LGWRGTPDPGDEAPRFGRGVYNLWRPDGVTKIDAQRFVVHNAAPWTRLPRRSTAAVWSDSLERSREGTRVRVPSPVDALLVCLILHRSWEIAPGRLKL